MKKYICTLFLIFLTASSLLAADLEVIFSDGSGKNITEGVVYALPLENQILPDLGTKPVELEQINKEFNPHVTVIQKGGTIVFPNRDSIAHHVYSFSETKKFELPLYSGVPAPVTFDKTGLVTLGCNIHDWMKAYILIVDTPFFAISDKNGFAELKDMPDGRWKLEFWHPRQKEPLPAREIFLKASEKAVEKVSVNLRREWKKKKSSDSDGPGY